MAYSTGRQRYITAPSKWKRGEDEQVYSKVNQSSSSTGKTIQDRNLQVSGGIEINSTTYNGLSQKNVCLRGEFVRSGLRRDNIGRARQ